MTGRRPGISPKQPPSRRGTPAGRIHRSTACGSCPAARCTGTCTLHPLWCRIRRACAVLNRTWNRRAISNVIRGSNHRRSSTQPCGPTLAQRLLQPHPPLGLHTRGRPAGPLRAQRLHPPSRHSACQAYADFRDTRNSLATTGQATPCSNITATSNRTRSRRACSHAVKPPHRHTSTTRHTTKVTTRRPNPQSSEAAERGFRAGRPGRPGQPSRPATTRRMPHWTPRTVITGSAHCGPRARILRSRNEPAVDTGQRRSASRLTGVSPPRRHHDCSDHRKPASR